jgi:hypothetical protein
MIIFIFSEKTRGLYYHWEIYIQSQYMYNILVITLLYPLGKTKWFIYNMD